MQSLKRRSRLSFVLSSKCQPPLLFTEPAADSVGQKPPTRPFPVGVDGLQRDTMCRARRSRRDFYAAVDQPARSPTPSRLEGSELRSPRRDGAESAFARRVCNCWSEGRQNSSSQTCSRDSDCCSSQVSQTTHSCGMAPHAECTGEPASTPRSGAEAQSANGSLPQEDPHHHRSAQPDWQNRETHHDS